MGRSRSSPARRAGSVAPRPSCSPSTAPASSSTTSTRISPSRQRRRSPGETAVYGGDLTAPGACDALVQTAIDAWGKLDIVVNNAGYTIDGMLHKMTDEGVPADARHPQRSSRFASAAPRRRTCASRPRRSATRRRGVSQDRQRVVDLGHDGQRRAGELRRRQGRGRGARARRSRRSGASSRSTSTRSRSGSSTRASPKRKRSRTNTIEVGGETVQLGIPEQIREDVLDAHPLGSRGDGRGGRRRRVLPLLAVVELRPRADLERHRRAVHRDDDW